MKNKKFVFILGTLVLVFASFAQVLANDGKNEVSNIVQSSETLDLGIYDSGSLDQISNLCTAFADSGFDNESFWDWTAAGGISPITPEADLPCGASTTGGGAAWLGSYANSNDTVCQNIYLPNAASASLQFEVMYLANWNGLAGNSNAVFDLTIDGTSVIGADWQTLLTGLTAPPGQYCFNWADAGPAGGFDVSAFADGAYHDICIEFVNTAAPGDTDIDGLIVDDIQLVVDDGEAGVCEPLAVSLSDSDVTAGSSTGLIVALVASLMLISAVGISTRKSA